MRKLKSLKLNRDFYWTGVLDPNLRVFDIIMNTEFGTTYNSYVLKGSEKTALFETAKAKFFDEYLETLKSITDINSVDYIIVSHTEPDHSGSIEKLLDINPNLKIVGTSAAISYLKEIVNKDFYSIAVKDEATLSLGNKTLKFMQLPNLHWPDTMYTYIEEDGILVTCDSFGAHYSHEGILRSTVTDEEGYMRAAKYYFDNIIGPFKNPFMTNALKKIDGLEINMICTGHGPVLDSHIDEIINIYKNWCGSENPNSRKTVVIPYVSAYGYTKEIAETVAEGIRGSGDVDVRLYDMVESDTNKVISEIAFADGILFGTPTILADALKPIWDLTTLMFPPVYKGKLASAFGSYGWSGEAVTNIIERLRQLKLKVLDSLKIRFKPDKNQLIEAFDFGYNFGCVLQSKPNPKKSARKTLVKCLVCGEIFSSELKICPVCGVDSKNFVEVNEEIVTFSRDTKEIFMILGSGTAAVNAAKAIRERNKMCSIVMITNEHGLPYNRPMLTKNMFAGFDNGQIAIYDEKWYEDNDIYIVSGKQIEKIDTEKREVYVASGEKFAYDKCIYALGGLSFVPSITGVEKNGVMTIRTAQDVSKLKKLLEENKKTAVIIGGGVLGIETAWELKKSKCEVTVIEAAPKLLYGKIDAAASDMLKNVIENEGIHVITGAKTEKIIGDNNAAGVLLEDGKEISGEIIIISCGMKPNIKVAENSGIETDRAVIVNSKMETNVRGIYACGDCASYNNVNCGLWPEASEMGKTAGINAVGDTADYMQEVPAVTLSAAGTAVYAYGDNGANKEKHYKTTEFKDETKQTIEKYYFIGNRIVGGTLLGNTEKMSKLTEGVKMQKSFGEFFNDIT